MTASSRRPRVGAEGGVATRDALKGLALQFETGAFVDAKDRERRARRETADATSEALRTYQLCASAKLTRSNNLTLVLTPVLRNFCARLLARLGRVPDRAVEADVKRSVRVVAKDVAATPGRNGELELMACIEKRLNVIAADVLAGRMGVDARGGEGNGESNGKRNDDTIAKQVAIDCASSLVQTLTPRENVASLLTPRILGFAQVVANASTSQFPSSELPGEVVEIAVGVCEWLTSEAERLETETQTDFEQKKEKERNGLDTILGLGYLAIAALQGKPPTQDNAQDDGSDERNNNLNILSVPLLQRTISETLPSALGKAATKIRAAAVAAAVRLEKRNAAAAAIRNETQHDASSTSGSSDSQIQNSLVSAGEYDLDSNHSGDGDEHRHDEYWPPRKPHDSSVFAITRAEAFAAVRACTTPAECAATLAEAPVRVALSPKDTLTADKNRNSASVAALGRKTVAGDQVVKDWLREGDGLTLMVQVQDGSNMDTNRHRNDNRVHEQSTSVATLGPGFAGLEDHQTEHGWRSEKLATGPFQAHFVSACGALGDALRDAGTCRGAQVRKEKPLVKQPPSALEAARSRWLTDEKRVVEPRDDSNDRAACATAAARVMLAGCRTVRGGDALDFVLELFRGVDNTRNTRPPNTHWMAQSVDPKLANRVLRTAGPSASVSVTNDSVMVVARDVFLMSRSDSSIDNHVPIPWTAVATKTKQTLAWDSGTKKLELRAREVGLDTEVGQHVLNGFFTEQMRVSAISASGSAQKTTTVAPRLFDRETFESMEKVKGTRR